jgi:hypothetical protein
MRPEAAGRRDGLGVVSGVADDAPARGILVPQPPRAHAATSAGA